MNKTQTIIGVIAVVALLVGIWAKATPVTVINQGTQFGAVSNTNAPAANTVLSNGTLLPNPSVLDYFIARTYLYTDKALGFGNSTGVPVNQQGNRQVITSTNSFATSYACTFTNPSATASSTFEFNVNISSSSATAINLILGTSITGGVPVATSTILATLPVAANAQFTASTQGTTTAGTSGVVGPGDGITLSAIAGAPLAQLGGVCNAIWTTIN